MIRDDIVEFLDNLEYGYPLAVEFKGKKYSFDGVENEEGKLTYCIWEVDSSTGKETLVLELAGDEYSYPIRKLLNLRIWDGMDLWQAMREMEWLDE